MKKGKVLSIDYGKRRIGVASGDFETGIAFPRTVIENKSFDFVVGEISKLCKELDVKTIIVGLPLAMKDDQRENRIMKNVETFVAKLRDFLKDIQIELLDERLSSFEAEELMRKYDMKGHDDLFAAQIILQRFFHKNEA